MALESFSAPLYLATGEHFSMGGEETPFTVFCTEKKDACPSLLFSTLPLFTQWHWEDRTRQSRTLDWKRTGAEGWGEGFDISPHCTCSQQGGKGKSCRLASVFPPPS